MSGAGQTWRTAVRCAQDTANLLNALSCNALVLLDELGKATGSTDGLAFAWAIAEEVLASGALAICASHFRLLAQLQDVYPVVSISHMSASADEAMYRHTHEKVAGPCTASHYGVHLAARVRSSTGREIRGEEAAPNRTELGGDFGAWPVAASARADLCSRINAQSRGAIARRQACPNAWCAMPRCCRRNSICCATSA